MSEHEEEDKGFKVTDRRKFTAEGKLRPEAQGEPAAPPPAARAAEAAPAAPTEKVRNTPPPAPAAPQPEPRIARPASGEAAPRQEAPKTEEEFLSLIGWLATNAVMQLGEVADPATGKRVENLDGAREFIDILTMLQRKTRGNLTAEESKTLEQLLYDLRMRFMAKANVLKT